MMSLLLRLRADNVKLPAQLGVIKMLKKECKVYGIWNGMRSRCNNPTNIAYLNYGGRGITVCNEWLNIWVFEADMGPRPAGHTLDRIDNDGPYSARNCRWATKKTQQRNQRWTRYVVIDEVRYKAVDLAEKIGIKTDTLVMRVNNGWDMEKIMDRRPKITISKEHKAAIKAGQERGKKARTHCPSGHEFTEVNTRITPQGWRVCRCCHRAKTKRQAERKRADKAC